MQVQSWSETSILLSLSSEMPIRVVSAEKSRVTYGGFSPDRQTRLGDDDHEGKSGADTCRRQVRAGEELSTKNPETLACGVREENVQYATQKPGDVSGPRWTRQTECKTAGGNMHFIRQL